MIEQNGTSVTFIPRPCITVGIVITRSGRYRAHAYAQVYCALTAAEQRWHTHDVVYTSVVFTLPCEYNATIKSF
jgi:hypothetical protein